MTIHRLLFVGGLLITASVICLVMLLIRIKRLQRDLRSLQSHLARLTGKSMGPKLAPAIELMDEVPFEKRTETTEVDVERTGGKVESRSETERSPDLPVFEEKLKQLDFKSIFGAQKKENTDGRSGPTEGPSRKRKA
jgi:hypothetical protein